MDGDNVAPRLMPLHLLEEITDGFSNDRKVGAGSYGSVYKGEYKNGETIAVKLLHYNPGLDDDKFMEEYLNLATLQHKNVVRLVGYCNETRREVQPFNGKMVLVEMTKRALCFEYMHNGSLDKYLSDESYEQDWRTRYTIIKGICQGLKYLHEELQSPMYHLDIKPANILLDKNMVPKLADFGLSRLFEGELTKMTTSAIGTRGYAPPEYIDAGIISNKFDVFSLGVVFIKIMTGPTGYYRSEELTSHEYIELVHANWTKRLLAESTYLLDSCSEQVKKCIEIALRCMDADRHKRPSIGLIVRQLNKPETLIQSPHKDIRSSTYKRLYQQMQSKIRSLNRLYQQMPWKTRSLNDSLRDTTQPGDIYDPNHQQATPSRNEPSSSYNMEANRNTFSQYAQDLAEKVYQSTFNQDKVSATPSNYFQENPGPREARLDDDSQFYRNDNQEYSADGDPLPGIEGFQIIGDPRPGSTLRACGFPTNGTTLCNFQWVRCLEDGTRQSIEGATMYDYVVTADDVGTLLAVDCTPMDDNGRQGDLVREFANGENKITCDQEMQNDISICISRGKADFDVFVLQGYSPDEWEHATLLLRRTGYQINISHKDEVVIDEKYSPNLQTKIPNGRTTQFVLVSSGGVNLPFNTQGITEPNSEDNDVRLRDLIVLVMRTFQNKALDAKRKGRA